METLEGRATQVLVVALLTALLATRAAAQSDTLGASRKPPRQVLTVQPVQSIGGIISGDYERSFGGPVTLGVGMSYWNTSLLAISSGDLHASYLSGEVKARFYPGERPFHGLSVGLTFGGAQVSATDIEDRLRSSGVKTGAEVDYNWLLGKDERFAVAVGLGAKRIFFSAYGDRFVGTYPTMRLAIGWGF